VQAIRDPIQPHLITSNPSLNRWHQHHGRPVTGRFPDEDAAVRGTDSPLLDEPAAV
jgi:hypothetical protein